jgi:endonuclease III related protein
VNEILEALEQTYGPQQAAGPTDPYEMIVYLNCGYPATDASCSKAFDALKQEVGLSPKEILAAPKARLSKLLRLGGIVPELRAARLKEIARKVKVEYGGDLKAALKKWTQEEKKQPGKGIRGAKKVLQEFPVVGEPSAEKILLFSKLAPVVAVPSAFVEVPARLWFGKAGKNYAADYRAARDILSAGLAETFAARQRAYLLLKKHGQQTCKRSNPKCELCPLTGQCAYIQLQAADRHAL